MNKHQNQIIKYIVKSKAFVNLTPHLIYPSRSFVSSIFVSIVIHLIVFSYFSESVIPPTLVGETVEIIIEILPIKSSSSLPSKLESKVRSVTSKIIQTQKLIVESKTAMAKEISPLIEEQTSLRLTVIESSELKANYIGRLRQLIEKKKIYPRIAKKLKQTGTVLLRFTILRNGKIIQHDIIEKTSFQKLNTAALQLVAGIKFFDPIPKQLNFDSWDILIPVEYSLR